MCPAGKPHLRPGWSPLLRHGRRHMRVKLCASCPYTPRDLAGHYDPNGVLHVCAKCDGAQEARTSQQPRKTLRMQKCATILSVLGAAQLGTAQSVAENLVLSDTTSAEPPSVQRSALTGSRLVKRTTADGYAGPKPQPDNVCGEDSAAILRISRFRSREFAQ